MIKARPWPATSRRGEVFLDRLAPLRLAQVSRLRGHRRRAVDEAADPCGRKGHGTIAVLGHNVKLGRGGIREIEFFVQTQQLIAGGRNADLRGAAHARHARRARRGELDHAQDAAEELKAAYRFLRTVEHRLQMVDDEQTQMLPADAARRSPPSPGSAAMRAGDLSRRAAGHVRAGAGPLCARCSRSAASWRRPPASLVFTGGDDDPETIMTLERLGFRRPSEVSATVRGWHFGRYAATRSARARELLTELMPALLTALAETADPDAAFVSLRPLPRAACRRACSCSRCSSPTRSCCR